MPLRRGRDLNSRYRLTPYGGLANRWFQPLTHLSVSTGQKLPRNIGDSPTSCNTAFCLSAGVIVHFGRMHILIIDDHAVVREGIKQILAEEFQGATFGEARDGAEGLSLASD